jgi:hypothetical protein
MNNAGSCYAFRITIQITGPLTLGGHTRIWECHLLVVSPDIQSGRAFARLYATSLFSEDVAVKITGSRRAGGPAFSSPYPRLLAGRANLVGEQELSMAGPEPAGKDATG